MADAATGAGGFTRGSRDLDFVNGNPAMDAFQAGQKAAQAQETHDEEIQAKRLANDQSAKTNPIAVRRLGAEADSAVAKGAVDTQTVPYKVNDAYNTMRTGAASADVAAGTVGSRISSSNSAARTAGAEADYAQGAVPSRLRTVNAGADVAESNRDVTVATAPNRVATSDAAASEATVNADTNRQIAPDVVQQKGPLETASKQANVSNSQRQMFDKMVTALAANDIDTAKMYASHAGEKIPDEILSNSEARKHFTEGWAHAKEAYPDHPALQHTYTQGYLKDIADRKAKGEPTGDPGLMLNVPGAPSPLEVGGGSRQGVKERIAQGLMAEATAQGRVLTFAEAINQASRASQSDTMAIERLANGSAKSENPDMSTLAKWREYYGLQKTPTVAPRPAQAAAPAAAPAAAAPPPPARDPLTAARDAIARGAPRDAVIKRMRDAGLDPSGL